MFKADAENALGPLRKEDETPAFSEAWQAELLALANELVEQGTLNANEWADELGAQLKKFQSEDCGLEIEGYYLAVLSALENLSEEKCGISKPMREASKAAWEKAYQSTPHGQPVNLD